MTLDMFTSCQSTCMPQNGFRCCLQPCRWWLWRLLRLQRSSKARVKQLAARQPIALIRPIAIGPTGKSVCIRAIGWSQHWSAHPFFASPSLQPELSAKVILPISSLLAAAFASEEGTAVCKMSGTALRPVIAALAAAAPQQWQQQPQLLQRQQRQQRQRSCTLSVRWRSVPFSYDAARGAHTADTSGPS